VPCLCEVYPDICLTAEEKTRRNLSQGNRRVAIVKEYTEQYMKSKLVWCSWIIPCITVQFIKKNPTRCNNVSIFYYSIFLWNSTYFRRHTAHHQEPKTALIASDFSYVEGCWTCGWWTLSGTVFRTVCTEPQCLYNRAIPLLPLWAVRPVQSLSACIIELYLYSPYGPYGLYRASAPV
jgi:hypothetical protein